jgi:hypothetical protein
VLGLLEGGAPIKVLRLTRDGNTSSMSQLPEGELKSVWSDPVLRYSNILEGLFHSKVVICEADADCRFYSAVLDALHEEQLTSTNPDDVLFVPSGGKQGIPKLANVLKELKVETYAIVDFDALKEKTLLRRIVESVGYEWDNLDSQYMPLVAALNGDADVRWKAVKNSGVSAVPVGEPSRAVVALLAELKARHVLVVTVGELEGFDRSISVVGTQWLSEMLSKSGHKTSSEAKELLQSIE